MDIIELIVIFVGIICVLIISCGLFLMKPYSEPIVTAGKIVEKYTLEEVKCYSGAFWGGSMPVTVQTLHIVILSEKGGKTKIQIGKEKYDSLEVDDPVEITECSRIKKIVEKTEPTPRNEGINN